MLFDRLNFEYIRQSLITKISRPQESIYLLPANTGGTILKVNVTSSTIVITYIAGSTSTKTITYTNKSINQVCAEINASSLPVDAIPLVSDYNLSSGDLLSTGSSKIIPTEFNFYDRRNKGVILRSKKISIKARDSQPIKLLNPYSDSTSLPWYPRIQNGIFTITSKERNYSYSIPEYDQQTWSSAYGKPIVDVYNESPTFIDTKTIKVSRTPLYVTGNNLVLFNGIQPISSSVIKDIDVYNGFIYLKDNVHVNIDSISINYSYIEKSFVYKGVNLNSHFSQNPFIQNKFVIIYLLPTELSSSLNRKQSVFHIVGDSVEEAIDKIEVDVSQPPLVIGAYSINGTYDSTQINILDTRSYGGGLVESSGPRSPTQETINLINEKNTEIEDKYIEARNYFDIGRLDGEVYPGSAVVIFDIPEEIKNDLSPRQVEDRASKFLAAGVYPIVEYTNRDLPAISGLSSQVSATYNLDFSSTILTGAGWTSTNFALPSGTIYSYWDDSALDINFNQINQGTGKVLRIDSNTGWYQSYLKSSPIAGIEWEERSYEHLTGNSNPYIYSEWSTKRIYDTRDVDNSSLVKGTLFFSTKNKIKEIRNVRINSPYRLDNITGLKSQLSGCLAEIVESYSGLYSSNITGYIRKYIYDIEDSTLVNVGEYFGFHEGNNYLFEMCKTPAKNSYTGLLESIGNNLNQNIFSGIFSFYDSSQDFIYQVSSPVNTNLVTPIYQLGSYASYRKANYGTGDSTYLSIISNIEDILAGLSFTENTILSDYRIQLVSDGELSSDITGLPYINGISFNFAQLNAVPRSDILTGLNEDFRALEMSPSIASCIASQASLPNIDTTSSPYNMFAYLGLNIANEKDHVLESITTPTYSGFQVADSYYVKYNRYGDFLGNYIKYLTQTYDILKDSITGSYGTYTQYTGSTSGTDPQMLDLVFKAITTGLYLGYSGVTSHIASNGIIEKGLLNVIKGYGWYINNYDTHTGLFSYAPDLTKSQCSGIYQTGIFTMLKGMTDSEGYIHEGLLVRGEKGPSYSTIPLLLFDTIIEGCVFDSGQYRPYMQAVLNTVTGLYNSSGTYYRDSMKVDTLGGSEFQLSTTFAKAYRLL